MIQTVLGPVESTAIGAASMHEHLLTDASALQRPGVEALEPSLAVTADLAAALRWSQLALADNLRLDDVDLLADELRIARGSGLGLAVDLSSLGFGPDHGRLPELSRASGVGIAAGYGAYLPRLVPEWYTVLNTDARQALFERALTEAVPGTDYRAALLGLMGTTAAFGTADGLEERRSLTAAAWAAASTGATVVVRLAADARNGLEVLAHVVAEGVDPSRVVFSTVDEFLDLPYLRDLGQAGAVLELCFGNEGSHVGRIRNASDPQRVDAFLALRESAPGTRWVFGHATWTKGQLRRYGGHGLDHLTARVVPGLRALGVPDDVLTRITVDEPARLLDRP
ncbi:phosphotriesterase [Curtobacterium sp. VKM Ac-1376]|uniref:phosphotriesterase family protein n=1 Tax=Curtobacterium sp. VKM Ac-1376 TaxID=123312 RepID=UPI00188C9A4F|nr:phosphotriesterase [Curtobacterium sp. VKM Ac-1376]MBF4615538.1 phosphotriesterase [Curtobacterium sp. VKM Ac-1376]